MGFYSSRPAIKKHHAEITRRLVSTESISLMLQTLGKSNPAAPSALRPSS